MIIKVVLLVLIFALIYLVFIKFKRVVFALKDSNNRLVQYYSVLNNWFVNKLDGKDIESYFRENGIKSVAVFGLGKLGYLLIRELEMTDIDVKYYINNDEYGEIFIKENVPVSMIPPIVKTGEIHNQEQVDAIIVTPIHVYKSITLAIKKEFNGDIISLEQLVHSSK